MRHIVFFEFFVFFLDVLKNKAAYFAKWQK